MEQLKQVVSDIKTLRIQGATNIAKEGVFALAEFAQRIQTSDLGEFFKQLEQAEKMLVHARPTEPALQNGIKKLKYEFVHHQDFTIKEIKELLKKSATEYVNLLTSTKKRIIRFGAERIEDGTTIMTHCHSSLASGIIIKAFEMGKQIKAVCTETRPLYQGRRTARELISAGVPTKMVVDSAMRWAIRQERADLIFIGADAFSSEGTVINKIGSRLLALAAKESDIPLYVATSLLKFDSQTTIGKRTPIEMRDQDEIWKDRPENLEILNPAFESISRDLIAGFITEKGIIPPSQVFTIIKENYPFVLQ